MSEGRPLIWVLADDRPGNASQCLGVAEALGLELRVRKLAYTAAGALPNVALGASMRGLTAASRTGLVPPWPDVVVAAGRRTGPVARQIKRRSSGATFLAQIMFPGRTGIAAARPGCWCCRSARFTWCIWCAASSRRYWRSRSASRTF